MKKHVLVCVSAGIAAYKVCDLVSQLVKKGYDVKCILSKNTECFVAPLTFEILSKNKVYIDEFETNGEGIPHIDLSDWADICIVAPATANTISKLVHGLADNLLTTTVLACDCPVLIAPAMNTKMLENPITQANLSLAVSFGFRVLESDEGDLACGAKGKGRLPDTKTLMEFIEQGLHQKQSVNLEHVSMEKIQIDPFRVQDNEEILAYGKVLERIAPLKGYKVVVSAGPTTEAIDPIRFITNHSTGKQGYAIAEDARDWGADVVLVTGPTQLKEPDNMEVIQVQSAQQMKDVMEKEAKDADFIIMAAAVADYRPKNFSEQKIKKDNRDFSLELTRNPDILLELSKEKKPDQVLCGFAMETQDLEKNALSKLEEKKLDLIVANNLLTPGAGFGGDDNVVTVIKKDHTVVPINRISKKALGYRILAEMLSVKKELLHAVLH